MASFSALAAGHSRLVGARPLFINALLLLHVMLYRSWRSIFLLAFPTLIPYGFCLNGPRTFFGREDMVLVQLVGEKLQLSHKHVTSIPCL